MALITVDNQVAEKIRNLAGTLDMTDGELLRKIFIDKDLSSKQTQTPSPKTKVPVLRHNKNLKEHDLIDPILYVLHTHGGSAQKSFVDNILFSRYQAVFNQPYYKEYVAHGVPRWKHFIAWAKEAAKQKYSYIKHPSESGRGIWELTDKGKEYCEKKFNYIET
ncbi:MAG: winged helix-turn-helix domain-containing protein [Candidatus Cloacimonetes bacterium]|nr:winged helix-turn-helix domain-containing protein [Candidatus Cloacimonadota bacterium]